MGSGQPNRVKSVQIALEKAREEVKVGFCYPWNSIDSIGSLHGLCLVALETIRGDPTGQHGQHCRPHTAARATTPPSLPSTPGAPIVQGSVLASDAFFPFSWNDSVEIACQVRGCLID